MPKILDKGKGALTRKVGPLPLWGWVVAGAAAVFLVSKMRGGRGGGSASGTDAIKIPTLAPGTPSTVGDGSIGQGGNAVGAPGGGEPPWWVPAAPYPKPILPSSPTDPTKTSGVSGTNPGSASPGVAPIQWRTAPVTNDPSGTVVVSQGTGTYETPGGSVAPGQ